jgi:hypothetical protein
MHQLSFSAFAAAQQAPAPVLPVVFEDVALLQRSRMVLDLRDDNYGGDGHWDVLGYCIDATRTIPLGSHEAIVCSNHVYVSATTGAGR